MCDFFYEFVLTICIVNFVTVFMARLSRLAKENFEDWPASHHFVSEYQYTVFSYVQKKSSKLGIFLGL